MRLILPAIAISLSLHAGVLALVGAPETSAPGGEGSVASTVIVFDRAPNPTASASQSGQQAADSAPAAAGATATDIAEKNNNTTETAAEPAQQIAALAPEPTTEAVEAPDPAAADEPDQPSGEPNVAALPNPLPSLPAEKPEPPEDKSTPRDETAKSDTEAKPAEARETVLPPEAVKPRAALRPTRNPARLRPARPAKAKPKIAAKPAAKPKREVAASRAERAVALTKSKTAAPRKSAGTGTATKDKRKTTQAGQKSSAQGGSSGRSGGASAGVSASYSRRLVSHIQRYKRYPKTAERARIRGTVSLLIRISGSGGLTSVSVRKGSGHGILDSDAAATARRASPFPAPPNGQSFSFAVSLRYAP